MNILRHYMARKLKYKQLKPGDMIVITGYVHDMSYFNPILLSSVSVGTIHEVVDVTGCEVYAGFSTMLCKAMKLNNGICPTNGIRVSVDLIGSDDKAYKDMPLCACLLRTTDGRTIGVK